MCVCLDHVDAEWLESWLDENENNYTWNAVESAFLAHFDNSNAMVLWSSQIRALKMGEKGSQRYTDQYLSLVRKLKWLS